MAQCAQTPGCIYVHGHRDECLIPNDNRDHSDDIRIRVLRDRIAEQDDEVVRLRALVASLASAGAELVEASRGNYGSSAAKARWLTTLGDDGTAALAELTALRAVATEVDDGITQGFVLHRYACP